MKVFSIDNSKVRTARNESSYKVVITRSVQSIIDSTKEVPVEETVAIVKSWRSAVFAVDDFIERHRNENFVITVLTND